MQCPVDVHQAELAEPVLRVEGIAKTAFDSGSRPGCMNGIRVRDIEVYLRACPSRVVLVPLDEMQLHRVTFDEAIPRTALVGLGDEAQPPVAVERCVEVEHRDD